MDTELPYWLALWRTPGVGPSHFEKARTAFDCLKVVFDYPEAAAKRCGFAADVITALKKPDWQGVDADLAWVASSSQRHIITQNAIDYPIKLREINAAPPLLFINGCRELLSQPQLAMVGSRNPTASGSDNAYQFAKTLVQSQLIVTSGLALGIDAASHEGALAGNGKTIAVMGTGPDRIYPKRHEALAKRIAETGVLITEFPTGVIPTAQHFPRRNRLISGLSMGVLVVEAAYGSGSLITAHYALEQNRDVFAIPGSIHNPLARGCHALIKQGAKLVETAQDILEEMQWRQTMPTMEKNTASLAGTLTEHQAKLLHCVGYECTPVDRLITRSGLTAEVVSSILLLLELEGYVTAVTGGYSRVK